MCEPEASPVPFHIHCSSRLSFLPFPLAFARVKSTSVCVPPRSTPVVSFPCWPLRAGKASCPGRVTLSRAGAGGVGGARGELSARCPAAAQCPAQLLPACSGVGTASATPSSATPFAAGRIWLQRPWGSSSIPHIKGSPWHLGSAGTQRSPMDGWCGRCCSWLRCSSRPSGAAGCWARAALHGCRRTVSALLQGVDLGPPERGPKSQLHHSVQ